MRLDASRPSAPDKGSVLGPSKPIPDLNRRNAKFDTVPFASEHFDWYSDWVRANPQGPLYFCDQNGLTVVDSDFGHPTHTLSVCAHNRQTYQGLVNLRGRCLLGSQLRPCRLPRDQSRNKNAR